MKYKVEKIQEIDQMSMKNLNVQKQLKTQIESLNDEIDSYSSLHHDFQEHKSRAHMERENLESQNRQLQSQIENLQKEIEQLYKLCDTRKV